jgi:excisionase family DNA binding protein
VVRFFCRRVIDDVASKTVKKDGSTMQQDAKVITVGELSEYLRVHRSTIYRLLKKGQLPAFKIGSDWRFNVEAIDRWRMQESVAVEDLSGDHARNVR